MQPILDHQKILDLYQSHLAKISRQPLHIYHLQAKQIILMGHCRTNSRKMYLTTIYISHARNCITTLTIVEAVLIKSRHRPVKFIKINFENVIIKWVASSRWSSCIYCPMRNSDEMTVGKTDPILIKNQPFVLTPGVKIP